MRPLSLPACLLLSVLFPLPHASAQGPAPVTTNVGSEEDEQDLAELSLEELMNIDVEVTSVSRKSETLSKSAAAIYVITAEDIRRSGAVSIPEALRMAPGLHVARLSTGAYAISARGFSQEFANKMLVLIDGRTVYTSLFSGVAWPNQDVVMEDIERIEVIRGPGAALWGANAVNGVINIITKRADAYEGTTVSVLAGTEETFTGTMRSAGRIGEDAYLRAYAKTVDRDGLAAPATGIEGDWESTRGGFRADWILGDGSEWTLQGDGYRSREQRSIEIASLSFPYVTALDTDRHDEGGNLLGRWSRESSNGTHTMLQSYLVFESFDTTILSEDRVTYDLEFQRRQALGPQHELIWGLNYRLTHSDTEGTFTLSFDPDHRTDNLFGIFIQDEFSVSDDLDLIFGTKLEHNAYSGFEIQPNLRASWRPTEQQTLWASVSRAVRTPSQIGADLILRTSLIPNMPPGFDTLVTYMGDEDFESEELLAYEVGYRVQPTANTSLDFALFVHQYDNLLTSELGSVTLAGPGLLEQAVVFDNQMDGVTYGFEVAAQYNVSERWRLHANYSLLQMDLDADSTSTALSPEYDEKEAPTNQAHVRSYFDLTEKTELDVAVYYVDHLSAGIGSYLRTDVRLGWHPTEAVQVSFVLQGLFHDDEQEFPVGTFGEHYGAQTGAYVKVSFSF